MTADIIKPVHLFYCYAREDEELRIKLDKHLRTLKQRGWITSWNDQEIPPGTDRQREIDEHLHAADIILLLVSSDFINSDYCYSDGMQEALRRHDAGEAMVIPVILRPVDWLDTPFGDLQALPAAGKPVTGWSNLDEALLDVEQGVRTAVKVLQKRVFISFAPADRAFAMHLKHDLEAREFTAWSAQDVTGSGKVSREKIVQPLIRNARAVLLIASPDTRSDRAVKEDISIAEMYQQPVVPVWAKGHDWLAAIPSEWDEDYYVDARENHYEVALQKIVARFGLLASATQPPVDPSQAPESAAKPRNPYKGLAPFWSNDAGDFFGRNKLVAELLDRFQEALSVGLQRRRGSRLLAIIGASGSGKSSVAMAGLLYKLQKGAIAGSNEWTYLKRIVPGVHPLEALAIALADLLPARDHDSLLKDLNADSARGLHTLASQIAMRSASETKVVLLIDQFEELFTLTTSKEERQQFIDVLVAAVTEPQDPVVVILTLRADFYDRPMEYPELARLIQEHQQLVEPMDLKELRSVIEGPASLPEVRLTFEGDLVGDLLFEVQGQVGALPLLQFTLDELFQRRSGHRLTLEAYHEIGGVKGALLNKVQETYEKLPSAEHRKLARALFLRLIDPGATEQDTTRRRAALSELALSDSAQTEILRETMNQFIAARLLTTNEVPGTPPTVEVSHEALIREWPLLSGWLREAREDIRLQQSLSEDVAEWIRRGKPVDRLYRGTLLLEVQAWAERNPASQDEKAFLEASVAERDREEAEKRAQQVRELELERHAAKRQRDVNRLLVVTSVVLVLLLIMVGVLYINLQSSIPVSVTNLNDSGPGSLRQAIADVNDGGAITFRKDLKGTIMLTSGELKITKNLAISGPGASALSINGGNTDRVFKVSFDVVVIISSLTIEHGYAAYYSTSNRSGNTFLPAVGGGIESSGKLLLINVTVSNNKADFYGGGIVNNGTLTLINSMVLNNKAGDDGGGIYNEPNARLKLTKSTVSGNTASLDGGGISSRVFGADIMLSDSTISGNRANRDGGGLYNDDGSSLDLSDSTVSGNRANRDGGSIFNNGSLYLTNSTVSDNKAERDGGGIATLKDDVHISFCTIYGNTAKTGGGIANVTTGKGGFDISASIVAGDQADTGPDVLGPLTLVNPNLIQDTSGAIVAFATQPGYPAVNELAKRSIFGKSPQVGPLQYNGGPTQTRALLPSSPAVDQIPDTTIAISEPNETFYYHTCSDTFYQDQRGYKRLDGQEKACDIGAYEYADR